jgi:hypothetical protein
MSNVQIGKPVSAFGSANRIKRIGAASVLLASLVIAPALLGIAQAADEGIAAALGTIASGQDEAFGKAVAPAQSLDGAKPREERVRAVIDRMAHEIETVRTAFVSAPAANRIAKTRAAVAQFSAETARDGASRSFEGNGPSLSIMRQLLFVPASSAVSSATIMQTISQFERSPKAEDNYYEYSDPADLAGSTIIDLSGTEDPLKVGSPMIPRRVYALKKCRHIAVLGWFCNTALYQVRELGIAGSQMRSLVTFLRPLGKGADNATFKYERAKNIADGYTAVYAVVAADNLVLVYSLGIQSKADAPDAQSRWQLDQGHKREYRQLADYLETTLGTGKLPF